MNSSPETKGAFAGALLEMCIGYYLTYRVKKDDSDYAATWLLVMIALETFFNFMTEGNPVKYVVSAVVVAMILPYAKHKLTTKS
jgi:RsiW-degrading membrane proteinase PrsW (M82 family)